MIKITAGAGNNIQMDSNDYVTLGDVLADSNIKAILRYGESVEGFVNGSLGSTDTPVMDGDNISIQTKANTKG